MIRFRAEDNAGGEQENQQQPAAEENQQPAPQEQGAQQEQAPAGVTRKEWEEFQAERKQESAILREIASYFQPEEPEPEEGDDPSALVDQRFQQYAPVLQAAVKEQGQKKMNEIFDTIEKEIKKPFDRKLAERVAHGFLAEGLDPVAATAEGAKFAAQLREEYGKEGEEAYKKSLKGGAHLELGGEGAAGEHSAPPAKSYDEVIERWSHQTPA